MPCRVIPQMYIMQVSCRKNAIAIIASIFIHVSCLFNGLFDYKTKKIARADCALACETRVESTLCFQP